MKRIVFVIGFAAMGCCCQMALATKDANQDNCTTDQIYKDCAKRVTERILDSPPEDKEDEEGK